MSLFGVEAPARAVGAPINQELHCSRQGRHVPRKASHRVQQVHKDGVLLFNDMVDMLFAQVDPRHCEEEVVPLSNGMTMITQYLVRDKVLHAEDGHTYQLTANLAANSSQPDLSLMRVLDVAQWSPSGESDGSFRYETSVASGAVERRYLGAMLEGVTAEERAQLAVIEHQMAYPLPMNKKMITTLGRSIMTVYPEFGPF